MPDYNISRHFKRSEFTCRCKCEFDTVDIGLITILERVRQHFNQPVFILSGCRCHAYNVTVGGSKNSQHTLGRAADIRVKNISPKEVFDYLNDKWNGGLGLYNSFVHIDSRNKKVRWYTI